MRHRIIAWIPCILALSVAGTALVAGAPAAQPGAFAYHEARVGHFAGLAGHGRGASAIQGGGHTFSSETLECGEKDATATADKTAHFEAVGVSYAAKGGETRRQGDKVTARRGNDRRFDFFAEVAEVR